MQTFEIRLNRMGGPEPEVLVVHHYFWSRRGPLDGVRVTVERGREREREEQWEVEGEDRERGGMVIVSLCPHCATVQVV